MSFGNSQSKSDPHGLRVSMKIEVLPGALGSGLEEAPSEGFGGLPQFA